MIPEPSQDLSRDRHAVLLVTAAWCIPCRPAPTLLRELARRWSGDVHPVLLEDPGDAQLDEWGISVLPTWLRLEPTGTRAAGPKDAPHDALADELGRTTADPPGEGPTGSRIEIDETRGIRDSDGTRGSHGLIVRDIPARAPEGAAVHLPGAWIVADRVEGALPKHVVHARFGPDSIRPDGDAS